MSETLVLITSVINPPDTGLSYCAKRSQFTCEERFAQTQQTINSVRKYVPNSKILLIETSVIPVKWSEWLENNCDYFLQTCDNVQVCENVYSKRKSLGEGTQTIHAINWVLDQDIQFDKLMKISGRYTLTQDFNPALFQNAGITAKQIGNNNGYTTVLDCMSRSNITKFRNWLRSFVIHTKMLGCVGYEVLFSEYISVCGCEVTTVSTLGITGYVSIDRTWYVG
jgi:hypothetical protein